VSHQVQLSSLIFDNLDILKEAIAAEGLRTVDYMRGYGMTYNKGQAYQTGQTLEFGIDIGGQVPCGIAKQKDGTYKLVGDAYGMNYRGTYGLQELSVRLNQRYRIQQSIVAAEAHGLEPVEIPSELLGANSKGTIDIVFQPKQRQMLTNCGVM
jgi:hypothetical protein